MNKKYINNELFKGKPIRSRKSGWVTKSLKRFVRTFLPDALVANESTLSNKMLSNFYTGGLAAQKSPHTSVLHGDTLVDNYKYMEDPHDRKTRAFVKAQQQDYAVQAEKNSLMQKKWDLASEVQDKMFMSTREGNFDKGEERIGEYVYYTMAEDDAPGNICFYRKRIGEDNLLGEELINPAKLQKQFGYETCEIGLCRVSENGKMLAYTLSVEGGDRFICHVRSVDSAAIFHVVRSNNVVSMEFGSANNFFYTECNELSRPDRVMMQELRPGLLPDPIEIYRDDDEEFFVDVRKMKDGKYLVISSDSKTRGNLCVIPSSFPVIPSELQSLFPDRRPIEIATKDEWSWLEHHGNYFVMVTSSGGAGDNYRIVYIREEVALKDQEHAEWSELVPMRPDVQVSDIDIFKTHLLVYEQSSNFEMSSQVRIVNISKGIESSLDRSLDQVLHFPPMTVVNPGLNKNFNQSTVEFIYSGMIAPVRECTYNLDSPLTPEDIRTTSPQLLYTVRQHDYFHPAHYMWPYTQYRDVAVADDGEEIPITICHRRDNFTETLTAAEPVANVPRNMLMYVYGAYGETPPMHFQPVPYLFVAARRWTVAFAHVRGGGEKPGWAGAGRRENKRTTITDFQACLKHMVDMGYTTPGQTVVVGNSAGAIPIAATMNEVGNELFDCAIMRSPFLDIINTMCDPTLPLTISERSEWGDPLNNTEDFKTIKEYCPYHNLNKDVYYPSVILGTSLDDERVPAWNSLKYIAKMKDMRAEDPEDDHIARPILGRLTTYGGHLHWNKMHQLGEEVQMLTMLFDLPMAAQNWAENDREEMTVAQRIANSFSVGNIDHDDAVQTGLKWDAWEFEQIDYAIKQNKRSMEPNFRVLQDHKTSDYYWDEFEKTQSKGDKTKKAPPPLSVHQEEDVFARGDNNQFDASEEGVKKYGTAHEQVTKLQGQYWAEGAGSYKSGGGRRHR